MLPTLRVSFRGCPRFRIGEKLLLHESLPSKKTGSPGLSPLVFTFSSFDHRMSL